MRRGGPTLVAGGIAALAAAFAGPAAARPLTTASHFAMVRGVSVTSSLSTDDLAFAGDPLTATLTLTTAAAAETAAIGLEPSAWPDEPVAGSPLRIGNPQVTGAGSQTGTYASSGFTSLRGSSVCYRGGPVYSGGGIDLTLPANTTTTVSWQAAFAAPPWWDSPLTWGGWSPCPQPRATRA